MEEFWTEITPSQFAWEQDALLFIRQRLPDHEPFRAWANFEFIADDGSINEVDLLVLSPKGFYLIEIKSRPGRLTGNAGSWIWVQDGREYVYDNPLILANRKAKKLISLLRRQNALKNDRSPFLEALVFCSATHLQCDLDPHARTGVCLRDGEEGENRQGIIHVLTKAATPEEARRFQSIDRAMAKRVSRAMEEAGIRPSNKFRKVGQYQLGRLLAEDAIYQEWEARHATLEKIRRRVRIYSASAKSRVDREIILRAAQREFQILEGIDHPGILRAENYEEHELGPALIFEHYPGSLRLDHYLIKRGNALTMDQRLHLLRQIGEAMAHAHEKKLIHRALNPQSVLVLDPDIPLPRLKIFNWQTARRFMESSTSKGFSATRHVQDLVENAGLVYLAPEVHTHPAASGEELDVFSLGAIAYHLFAGQPPAETIFGLVDKLTTDGLRISSVMDGAGEKLQELILYATHRDASLRMDSMKEFLALLDEVEEELTRPDIQVIVEKNPLEAKAGDHLQGGWLVRKRLGRGSTSMAFLVERDGRQVVLKLADGFDHNERIREEARVLEEIRRSCIVALEDEVEIGGLRGLLLQYASKGTLAEVIRRDGRIHSELLERFGGDLLQAVNHLEEHGLSHRDIKPGNLGLVESGSKGKLHLILFDFSLSRAAMDNIRAGTPPYLDPFLKDASRRRWDLHAERFAAAMTLYEMATGTLPRWGDGKSDPALLACEVHIDGELFEPSLREGLQAFFAKALARRVQQRFDTCEEMLRAFNQLFREVERAEHRTGTVASWESVPYELPLETLLTDLPFSDRALSALDRLAVRTVGDFLNIHIFRLSRLRGMGRQTQKELTSAHRRLSPSRPTTVGSAFLLDGDEEPCSYLPVQSVDLVASRLMPEPSRSGNDVEPRALRIHLGLEDPRPIPLEESLASWPGQADIAQAVGVTRGRISQILTKTRDRWSKHTPVLTTLRGEIADILLHNGGVMTLRELGDAVLVKRGSALEGDARLRTAQAVTRAALELERDKQSPRWIERRSGSQLFLAWNENGQGQERADYAIRLGRQADELARLDPLPAAGRVFATLQNERLAEGMLPLSRNRLLQLAVNASQAAALSSRQEIYPRGLSAERALKLAQGALLGARELTITQVRERVEGRYPLAEPLPSQPDLDHLLSGVGCEFRWNPMGGIAQEGSYQSIRREFTTFHQSTLSTLALSHGGEPLGHGVPAPEVIEARDFHQRLTRAMGEGAFLALRVPPKQARKVEEQLRRSFPLSVRDFDALFLTALKNAAREVGVKRWAVVLEADGQGPQGSDWRNLMALADMAIPQVEQQLQQDGGTVLLTNPGLLARYHAMGMIGRLQEHLLKPKGLQGLWMLIPADDQAVAPLIQGEAVPVITPNQWARVPDGWIQGRHEV